MVIYEVKMKRQQLAPDFYIIINQMLFWRDKAGNKKMSHEALENGPFLWNICSINQKNIWWISNDN